MKKVIYILKSSDKTGLKLTAVYGLNWLVEQLVSWQFYFVAMFVLANSLSVWVEMIGNTIDNTFFLFFLFPYCLSPFLKMLFSGKFNDFALFVRNCLASGIFVEVYNSSVKEINTVGLMKLIAISYLFYFVMKRFQPKVFSQYLFTNVLNKEYMGVRKLSDELPPADNFYKDADEADAEKGMAMINSRAVKLPYQQSVELSYLNSERRIGKIYFYDSDQEPLREKFTDIDTIYRPYFTLYPFGKEIDFYFKLISFELSRKDAFTKLGSAYLASK